MKKGYRKTSPYKFHNDHLMGCFPLQSVEGLCISEEMTDNRMLDKLSPFFFFLVKASSKYQTWDQSVLVNAVR